MLSQNHRKTTSAMALDELKRREDLESLRKYLVSESCFPTQKDPMTGVITMEELKKLARVWKLNERRNFWKTHTEREEMVAALLEHIEDNQKILSKKLTMAKNYNRNETPEVPGAGNNFGSPTPPKEVKPSYSSGRIGSLTDVEFRNYCGLKVKETLSARNLMGYLIDSNVIQMIITLICIVIAIAAVPVLIVSIACNCIHELLFKYYCNYY